MLRENIHDLLLFFVVAREKSFTRAASQLGLTQSALSHAIRGLEARLNLRLLTRTTRSVEVTPAGEQLIQDVFPLLQEVEEKLETITQLSGQPSGTIRLTTVDLAAQYVLWPKLKIFLEKYPNINIEISSDYGLVDIVSSRFDAGIRLGEHLAKDMIGVCIGPNMHMAVVATPSYFKHFPKPKNLEDLDQQNCINLRLPTSGGLYPWEFDVDEKTVKIRVKGQLTFNTYPQILTAALDGFGLAYIPHDIVKNYITSGHLISVLEEFCQPFPGYYLYYPSRRHHTAAFNLLVQALRYHH
ncbi:LysR family transcriptional regulator [Bartonella sp. HY406]|uniref:LysR family transcriptional regulator n=1 Tax=Bartonella sp. HY406 TaxID=2979331 RepID=UPI0021C93DEB|nr:LysR family transcriptional regulator [Bartonella sp. HY406]UXN03106.1 LysR family transcriptional regulator [Bartonella sp. HY406]